MPRAPKHCGINGCTTIVPNGQRCPEHTHRWGTGAKRTGNHRDQQWSRDIRARDKCCMIRLPGCTGGADTADHITPVKFGGARYDLSNGQAACWHCHNRKSSGEGHIAQGHTPRT